MFKKLSLTFVLFVACCISFAAFLLISPSHAYFQGFTALDGVNSAKIDLLFDKFDDNGTYGDYEITLKDDNWGTEENPYLLTKKNHVSNLFVLQRSGYFLRKTNSDGSTRQSHFMVCDPATGETLAINCDGMTINPIGSPTNPFTGCIQGAPVAGEATYTVNDKTYTVTQSTIANLKVVTTATDTVINPDVGFFGRLGYAGKEETQSDGTISIVADTVNGKTVGPFAASVNNLIFPKRGGEMSFSVVSDGKYEITKEGDWFSFNVIGNNIVVTTDVNSDGVVRSGKLIIRLTDLLSGECVVEVPVTQYLNLVQILLGGYGDDVNLDDNTTIKTNITIGGYGDDVNLD
jgi:hypothetical protein